jgi:hypothetical protein
MDRKGFILGMTGSDWKQDAYGHFKISANGKQYRLKVQATSVRYEVKQQDGNWFNKASDYYKNMEFKTVEATGRTSLALRGYRIPLRKLEGE